MSPFDEENADQDAMMAEAEFEDDGEGQTEGQPEGKPSIVYEEFRLERPDAALMTEDEIAASKDDGSQPDMVDDEEVDAEIDDGVTAMEPVPAVAKAPVAVPPVDLSIDYAAKLAETNGKIADLKTQLADGEIGEDQFADQLLVLAEERGTYRAQATLADTYNSQKEAVEADQFSTAVKAFKLTHPHLFTQAHFDQFNADVQEVTGSTRFNNLTFTQKLEKAALDYAYRTNNPKLAAATAKVGAQPAPKPAPAPKAARLTPVPTLARVPAAAKVAADGSKYAALDSQIDARNIGGVEAALSRMTKEQLENYGAGI